MPIKIPNSLPAKDILANENIFVMDFDRAEHQNIRPLNIGILNLMPTKQTTEVQLLRLLGNTPLQVNVTLLRIENHVSKNTSSDYLDTFYKTFNDVKHSYFDGFIITGAPIEMLPFEDVSYWEEISQILEWTKTMVTSTFHICWGAQAALYYHYNIKKYPLEKKMFGVFEHTINKKNVNLLRGFDTTFFAPHSRHTEILSADISKVQNLETLAESEDAGVYIAISKDGRQIFVTGHSEYDKDTIAAEYFRDINVGKEIELPKNYFTEDNPEKEPKVTWRAHGSLLFSNWLNYYVYQETPFVIKK